MKAPLAASLLLLALGPSAWGHGPAPAPLELLQASGSDGSFTPSLVRLNIGLARASNGSWFYGCPSQYGDAETARMASTERGELVVAVGGGDAYVSTDEGCSFEPVNRDEAEPLYALRTSADGDGVWVLAGNVSDSEGAVSRLDAQGEIETTRLFTGGEGWLPDSLTPWSWGDRSGVLVAGASPSPRLWRGERQLNSSVPQWTWTSWPLSGLDDSTAFLRLSPPDEDGAFWLVATDQGGRNLWRGTFTPDAPPQLKLAHAPANVLKGPVTFGERHLALFDGELKSGATSDEMIEWTPLGEVGWTCLDEVGGMVLACSLTRLEQLMPGDSTGVPLTSPLFLLAELQGPVTTCMTPEEEAQCFADWVHFGVEAGLYTPGDPLQSTPEASAQSDGCGAAGSHGWGLLMWTSIAGLAWSRRRRAC